MKNNQGKQILISTSSFGELNSAPLKILCDAGYQVTENPFKRKLTKEELISLLKKDVIGIIAGLEIYDREVMGRSNLRVISRCGAGISSIDLSAAAELGIKILSTPDAPTNAVAEMTIGAMLFLIRGIAQMNQNLHENKWKKQIGMQLGNTTVLIIGFGRIGRRVAQLLVPFQAKVIAVDPKLNGSVDGVKIYPLKEALPIADIISIHADGEKPILGPDEFLLLKKGVFLLNAGRGNLIDEKQLIISLDSAKVAGAWIDCFWEEPYSGELTKYSQVLLTPHAGSYTKECRLRMEMEAVQNMINFLNENE